MQILLIAVYAVFLAIFTVLLVKLVWDYRKQKKSMNSEVGE